MKSIRPRNCSYKSHNMPSYNSVHNLKNNLSNIVPCNCLCTMNYTKGNQQMSMMYMLFYRNFDMRQNSPYNFLFDTSSL